MRRLAVITPTGARNARLCGLSGVLMRLRGVEVHESGRVVGLDDQRVAVLGDALDGQGGLAAPRSSAMIASISVRKRAPSPRRCASTRSTTRSERAISLPVEPGRGSPAG